MSIVNFGSVKTPHLQATMNYYKHFPYLLTALVEVRGSELPHRSPQQLRVRENRCSEAHSLLWSVN